MAAVTAKLESICAGGNHLHFSITGRARHVGVELSSLNDPIEEEDLEAFLRVLIRLGKQGRTLAQARALFQTGVTVNV